MELSILLPSWRASRSAWFLLFALGLPTLWTWAHKKPQVPHLLSAEKDDAWFPLPMELVVVVKGHVQAPGIYPLGRQVLLGDLIEMAGGVTTGSVSSKEELRRVIPGQEVKVHASSEGSVIVDVRSMPGSHRLLYGLPIEINVATAEDFKALPGAGPKLAGRLVDDREAHGAFYSVEELQRVSGVGPMRIERWKDLVSLGCWVPEG